MTPRDTIGENPLDAVIPKAKTTTKRVRAEHKPATAPPKPKKIEMPTQKERLTIHVSSQLVDRLRNAVYWTPGLTLAAIAEEGLARLVETMEKKRGEPFAQRKGAIKTGRPVK